METTLREGFHLLRRRKGPVCHYGVLAVVQGRAQQVFELLPEGYRRTDLVTFAAGRRVSFLDWRPLSEGDAIAARLAALPRCHPRWNLFGNNCEHAARGVLTGHRKSRQVFGFAAAAAVLLAIGTLILRR